MTTVVDGALRHHWPLEVPELALRFTVGMTILILNAADVMTTWLMLERGGVEANPVAGWFLENGTLAEVKMSVAGVVAVFLVMAPRRAWIPRAMAAVIGAYVGVVCGHLVQLARI